MLEKFPIVLRHGDFFAPNIFYANDKIVLIDWDSAGWCYLGEDMVSLLIDTDDIDHLASNFHKCVSAYLKGFSKASGISQIKNPYIYARIVMHMGYRLIDNVDWRNETKTPDERKFDLELLQKIYELGRML